MAVNTNIEHFSFLYINWLTKLGHWLVLAGMDVPEEVVAILDIRMRKTCQRIVAKHNFIDLDILESWVTFLATNVQMNYVRTFMEIRVIHELIHSFLAVVARNEVLFAMELFNEFLDFMSPGPPRKITQAEDKVIRLNHIIPVFDETPGHFLLVLKRPVTEPYNIAMPEMEVRGEENVLVGRDGYINFLHNGSMCLELSALKEQNICRREPRIECPSVVRTKVR